jgi:hypothetical protein
MKLKLKVEAEILVYFVLASDNRAVLRSEAELEVELLVEVEVEVEGEG